MVEDRARRSVRLLRCFVERPVRDRRLFSAQFNELSALELRMQYGQWAVFASRRDIDAYITCAFAMSHMTAMWNENALEMLFGARISRHVATAIGASRSQDSHLCPKPLASARQSGLSCFRSRSAWIGETY